MKWGTSAALIVGVVVVAAGVAFAAVSSSTVSFSRTATSTPLIAAAPSIPPLDKNDYNQRLLALAHVPATSPWYYAFLAGTTTPLTATGQATTTKTPKPLWPVNRVYPNAGAILPFYRIVAYYGNFYSTAMGVLGEYPPQVVLQKLASTSAAWAAADPSTPVMPAIHYIVVTAQGSAGADGKYRARMPDSQVEKALEMATQIHGLLFLDFQVGLSDVQNEIPQYAKYYALPNVEVGIDPEFSMKDGTPPGHEIGTFDASDVNWVANYLAGIVNTDHLPPKILVVHRFTEDMVTHVKSITPLPQVQIVMDMDGWGFPAKKVNTYNTVIEPEPVQFTGFKLFYKADLQPPTDALMTPAQVLKLTPAPIYIQYQ